MLKVRLDVVMRPLALVIFIPHVLLVFLKAVEIVISVDRITLAAAQLIPLAPCLVIPAHALINPIVLPVLPLLVATGVLILELVNIPTPLTAPFPSLGAMGIVRRLVLAAVRCVPLSLVVDGAPCLANAAM
jgi:hypothetical protein